MSTLFNLLSRSRPLLNNSSRLTIPEASVVKVPSDKYRPGVNLRPESFQEQTRSSFVVPFQDARYPDGNLKNRGNERFTIDPQKTPGTGLRKESLPDINRGRSVALDNSDWIMDQIGSIPYEHYHPIRGLFRKNFNRNAVSDFPILQSSNKNLYIPITSSNFGRHQREANYLLSKISREKPPHPLYTKLNTPEDYYVLPEADVLSHGEIGNLEKISSLNRQDSSELMNKFLYSLGYNVDKKPYRLR